MAESPFELANVVQGLRQELLKAVEQAKGEELRFEVQEMELELQVGVTAGGEAGVGLKFWVVELGSVKGTLERSTVQTVRLKLKPAGKGGALPRLGRPDG